MVRTTLHTVFSSRKGEPLGIARINATLDRVGLVIGILILEDTAVRIVPELFAVLESIFPETRKNLHPAVVVFPARWEVSEDRRSTWTTSSSTCVAASSTGRSSASIVVDVQAVRSTAKLR